MRHFRSLDFRSLDFRSLGFALALLPFTVGAASAAQMVVIGVSGAEHKPGEVIDSDDELTLPAGSSLTLIGADGTPVQLSGPYSGKPGAGTAPGGSSANGPDVVGALAQLFSVSGTTDTSLGATRNQASGDAVPDARAVPVGRSGAYCVVADGSTYLWRLDNAEALPVTLRATDGSWEGQQQFMAGQSRLPLPPDFPAASKVAFELAVGADISDIVLHRMPDGLSKPGVRAAWMVNAGCELQARALLASLK